jgi:hypothetical protein
MAILEICFITAIVLCLLTALIYFLIECFNSDGTGLVMGILIVSIIGLMVISAVRHVQDMSECREKFQKTCEYIDGKVQPAQAKKE